MSVTEDYVGPEHVANRGSIRLREVAVACMLEATALNRIKIAEKTQTRTSGQDRDYKVSDLVDIFRKLDGVHDKDNRMERTLQSHRHIRP